MVRKLASPQDQVDLLRDLLMTMVEAIVEFPDAVKLEEKVLFDRYVVGVRVAASDVGLVLGKGGETADSMRKVLWCACKKTDFKIDIMFSGDGRESHALNRR